MRLVGKQHSRVSRVIQFVAVIALHVDRSSTEVAALDEISHPACDVAELIVMTGGELEPLFTSERDERLGVSEIQRERFLDVVWGYGAFPTTRTVDMHIASLRRKLEKNPDEPRWITTVHGVGYCLETA